MKNTIKILCCICIAFSLSTFYVNASTDTDRLVDEYYNKGFDCKMMHKYIEAIQYFDLAIGLKPNDYTLYNIKASVYLELKDYQSALKYYNKSLELDSKYNTEAYLGKGDTLSCLKRYYQAIMAYDNAIKRDQKCDQAYYDKGIALYELKKYDEALGYFDKAISLDNDSLFSYDTAGYSLYNMGKYPQSIYYFNKAISMRSDFADPYIGKGLSLHKMGSYQDAIECFNKALEIEKNLSTALYGLSCTYAKLNNVQQSITNLKKAMLITPVYKEIARLEPDFESITNSKDFTDIIGIDVKVDGTDIIIDIQPECIKDDILLPARTFLNSIGVQLNWNQKDCTTTAVKGKNKIVIQNNSKNITVNGTKMELDIPTKTVNGKLVIPINYISKIFGATVTKNNITQTIYIKTILNPKYTDEQREWALATNAMLSRNNNKRLDIIGGALKTGTNIKDSKNMLSSGWGITDRQSALTIIKDLKDDYNSNINNSINNIIAMPPALMNKMLEEGEIDEAEYADYMLIKDNYTINKSKSLTAWNYCRLVGVAGDSYIAGYITYDEAWNEIMSAAKVLKKKYSSWEELGSNYMLGGILWQGESYYGSSRLDAYYWLLTDQNSPWKRIKWDIIF